MLLFQSTMRSTLSPALVAAVLLLLTHGSARALPTAGEVILFPYFKAEAANSVFLMASSDGLTFEHLNGGAPIFTAPEQVTRDPSILRGPDGLFHMVYTGTATNKSFGYTSSPDLVNWSEPRTIGVWGPEDDIVNTWAPEIHYLEDQEEYLIVWSSTDRSRFPVGSDETRTWEHRLYSTTTSDFETFSDTTLFFDPGHNVIDGIITFDADTDRFVMAFKHEGVFPTTGKYIHFAFSDSALGPWAISDGEVLGGGTNPLKWLEGPSLLRFGDRWRLYADSYTLWGQTYAAWESEDLETWVEITDQLAFPDIDGRLQHGTLFRTQAEAVGLLVPEPRANMLLASMLLALGMVVFLHRGGRRRAR